MPYFVYGRDKLTRQPRSRLIVSATSVEDAAAQAASMGVEVEKVEDSTAAADSRPEKRASNVRKLNADWPGSRAKLGILGILIALLGLILARFPITSQSIGTLGVLLGTVGLIRREESGPGIWAVVLGSLVIAWPYVGAYVLFAVVIFAIALALCCIVFSVSPLVFEVLGLFEVLGFVLYLIGVVLRLIGIAFLRPIDAQVNLKTQSRSDPNSSDETDFSSLPKYPNKEIAEKPGK